MFVGVQVAARMLNGTPDDVYKLIETGELKAYRLHKGGWWKISSASVVAVRNRIRKQYGLN